MTQGCWGLRIKVFRGEEKKEEEEKKNKEEEREEKEGKEEEEEEEELGFLIHHKMDLESLHYMQALCTRMSLTTLKSGFCHLKNERNTYTDLLEIVKVQF